MKNGFKYEKGRASFESTIFKLYFNLFLDRLPCIKIDAGIERTFDLRYPSLWQEKGYDEYHCWGVRIEMIIIFFRIGIYFTPFCFKQK